MIININSKQFREGISKLCKISSIMAMDSYSSQIKLTAKDDSLFGEAINETKTQTLIVKFDETVCSIQEPGICCVPAKALQQTIELMLCETIELSSNNNMVSLKPLPYKKQNDIQVIEGIDPSQWLSVNKINSENIIELNRDFFLHLSKYTSNSCSMDKSKAPLTAIHINIFIDGKIECTASDYIKISLYDCNNGFIGGSIKDNIAFMLPVDIAKKIPQIFNKDIDVIKMKIDSRKISLKGGNIVFIFSTEAGVERYPPLRSYISENMISYNVELNNLIRISGLLSAVASKSSCNITFENNKICFEAQEGHNKSRQILDTEAVFIQDEFVFPYDIRIAIYDLVSSLSIPDKQEIDIGLVSINNQSFGYLFEIMQKEEDISWRQIILTARKEIPEDENNE